MRLDKPDPEALQQLLQKYETLALLRREHAEGKPTPDRAVFKALASSFPGALAELDRLPLEVIEARIKSLKQALEGGVIEAWIPLSIGYHALSRAALRIRARSLKRKERVVSEERASDLAQDASSFAGIEIDTGFVRAALSPPKGRMQDVVLERLSVLFGVEETRVREVLLRRKRAAR